MRLGQRGSAIMAGSLVAGTLAAIVLMNSRATATTTEAAEPLSVYWSDGDSGRLSDGTKFRLHGVDAPETGGVGAFGGAQCEGEREIGYRVKETVVIMTRNQPIEIARDYGADRYGRRVVDLTLNGEDLANRLVALGALKVWDYDGGDRKPDWCSQLDRAR